MTTFLVLYHGKTIGEAKLVATSADRALVAAVAAYLIETPEPRELDPVLTTLARGRRAALRLITREVDHAET